MSKPLRIFAVVAILLIGACVGSLSLYRSLAALWTGEIGAVKSWGALLAPDRMVRLDEQPGIFWGNVVIQGSAGLVFLAIAVLSGLLWMAANAPENRPEEG
jgi:hypothetical protein